MSCNLRRLFYLLLFCSCVPFVCYGTNNDGAPLMDESCDKISSNLPIADPYILNYDGTYYAYGTRGNGFEVYISDDLKHWKRGEKLALSPKDSWGTKWYWAPEVYYVKSKISFICFIL